LSKKSTIYKEGDWFAVPLRRGKHALGLVARKDRRGDSFLGYYFAPDGLGETAEELASRLTAQKAVMVSASGAYGLVHRLWRVFGRSNWNRDEWPIPVFQRTDMSGRTFLETYGDEDVLLPIPAQIQVLDPRIPAASVKSGLLDAGAVEETLWQRLRNQLTSAE
jgi:hypothetical protein